MAQRTANCAMVLRLTSLVIAWFSLSVSLLWLCYAVYLAPPTGMLTAQAALVSLLLPLAASLLLVFSRPIAKLITADIIKVELASQLEPLTRGT